jgi:two-component system OmpR family sensor kinase
VNLRTSSRTLGGGLGRALAVATILGMMVFATGIGIVLYVSELDEECAPGIYVDDPPIEIVEEVLVALAFAAPVGLGLSLLIGRRLIHGTTDRLDEVIASAGRMRGDRLDERLPISPAGDPLDRLAKAINAMLERLESGVAAQRQFAADASHELRTPLSVISANLEIARRKPRDAPHWEQVADDTLAEVQRMHLLVDKLLVLARAGAAGLHREVRALRGLATAAVERAQPIAGGRDVQIVLAAGAEVVADLDPDAVAIVLDNLLRNAIDHAPPGSEVAVVIDDHDGPRLAVEDHGPGVPPELRARVFEPFARGTGKATDRAVGTGVGLGLAISKRIIDGHGGTIGVEDRPGGGARFWVTLPAPSASSTAIPVVAG